MEIRPEHAGDVEEVRDLNEAAFGQPHEGKLVDLLRENCADALSLVAEAEGRLVGHILFTPVRITAARGEIVGMGLAPMSVYPTWQNRGVGTTLITEGLELLKERGCPFCVVLGHSDYYPRFGFEPASSRDVKCQWEGVPDEAFMIQILDARLSEDLGGTAHYRPEFDQVV